MLTRTIDIGNAKIAGLMVDLKLSDAQFEWLLTAFYITYIAFEWMALLFVSQGSDVSSYWRRLIKEMAQIQIDTSAYLPSSRSMLLGSSSITPVNHQFIYTVATSASTPRARRSGLLRCPVLPVFLLQKR